MSSKNKNSRENKNNDDDQILPNIREIFNDRFFPIHRVKIRKIMKLLTLQETDKTSHLIHPMK